MAMYKLHRNLIGIALLLVYFITVNSQINKTIVLNGCTRFLITRARAFS
jgi:hypothetical protein